MGEPVWHSEPRIFEALNAALRQAVEHYGNPAKAMAWDISHAFKRELGQPPLPPPPQKEESNG